MKTVFEIHLAIPQVKVLEGIRAALLNLGFGKVKYFHRVRDLRPITPGCMNGHDIDDPGMMATFRVDRLDESTQLVNKGMRFLRDLGIRGMNFEIEAISSQDLTSTRNRLSQLLPQYEKVPNSPEWESHLIYKEFGMPSDDDIVKSLTEVSLELNQIVDFGHQPKNAPGPITRVATLYHADKVAAQRVHQILTAQPLTWSPRIVTEEVLFVGKFPG